MQSRASENTGYQAALQQMTDAVEPILYFPDTPTEQYNIIHKAPRPCFYIDKNSGKLWYINSLGSQIPYKDNLQSKRITDFRRDENDDFILDYKKKEHASVSSFHHMKLLTDTDLGAGFRVPYSKMRALIADAFEPDKTIMLLESILMRVKHPKFEERISLFANKHSLSELYALLAIAQQIMAKKLTERIVFCEEIAHIAPVFKKKGASYYVFVKKTKGEPALWHVDCAEDEPIFVQLPMNLYQSNVLRALQTGPSGDEQDDAPNAEWHSLSKSELSIQNGTGYQFDTNSAQKIANLLLSDNTLCKNIIEDWSYSSAFDALSDTLRDKNDAISQRCQKIQRLLDEIGEDLYKLFPKTRGIVPQEQRVKILSMLNTLLKEPQSPEATHYLRTRHRVHKIQDKGFSTTSELAAYSSFEPSSFLWLPEKQELEYIDEHINEEGQRVRRSQTIPMTPGILKKFQALNDNGEDYISTDEVYDLMTKPHLFYYLYGVPLCIDTQWLDFKYFIPTGFNRSQGLHTGTAQEMIHELYDIHLSARSLLFKLGQLILFFAVPMLLSAVGLWIPVAALLALGAIQMIILHWSILVAHVVMLYTMARAIFLNNEVMQPALNQLDETLKEIDNILKISELTIPINRDAQNIFDDDNPSYTFI